MPFRQTLFPGSKTDIPYEASAGFGINSISSGEYFFSQGQVILHYLRLIPLPSPIVFDYDWQVPTERGPALAAVVGVLILVGASLFGVFKKSPFGFLGFWFFGILALTSSIVPIRDLCVEHRLYLSSIAIIILIVSGIHFLLDRFAGSIYKSTSVFIFSVLCIACISLTIRRNYDYTSEINIWEDTIKKRPLNARAYNNLGKAYMLKKDYVNARDYVDRSIELKEDNKSAHNNRGNILSYSKKYKEAIPSYLRALELDPYFAEAHNNLANAYAYLENFEKAIKHYHLAIRYDPFYGKAYLNYGQLLNFQGKFKEALAQLRNAEKWIPNHVPLLLEIVKSLGSLQLHKEALPYLERSLAMQPRNADVHNLLGIYHIQQGDKNRAKEYFQRAVALNPSHGDARKNLAWFEQQKSGAQQ